MIKDIEIGNYEILQSCPWCGDAFNKHTLWCKDPEPFRTFKCPMCGMIYVQTRLSKSGRDKFYKDYYSRIHQEDETLVKQRDEMYKIEHKFIEKYIDGGRVLDVGCSGGTFLTYFLSKKWSRWGLEFGTEAIEIAKGNLGNQVLGGELTDYEQDKILSKKFDLIIFRGVIEHVANPKEYLETAIKLLAPKGKIFIGSTPNRNSLCADLFREQWSHHDPKSHLFHFAPDDFIKFFYERGLKLVGGKFFYMETPYATLGVDQNMIGVAVEYRALGKKIDFKSPPFYGNLMTLMFEKQV